MPLAASPRPVTLSLRYELSGEQNALSRKIIENFDNGTDTLVYAVCGAGKTELTYGVIAEAVSKGLRVGFALPRRDVVIELYWRIKDAFPNNSVVAVYGQHTSALEGDIIILTTHQLFRYPNYFDLLVMDEIDAFPFKGNDVLIAMYKKSLKGHCVMMSATPSKDILNEFKKPGHSILELRTRFHKKEIPVPKFIFIPKMFQPFFIIKKLREYKRIRKPCFVFAPTIEKCENLYSLVKLFVRGGAAVHSKKKDRDTLVSKFKKGELVYLITTSILERGITVKDLQVIIYQSDDEKIYDSSTLIQTAGRAGRKIDAPTGDVFFLGESKTYAITQCIDEIKFCNSYL